MWNRITDSVNPIIVIIAIVAVVLFVFLTAVYTRVGWEQDFFGIKRWMKRRQRRRRKQPPVYGPLQHDLPSENPKTAP